MSQDSLYPYFMGKLQKASILVKLTKIKSTNRFQNKEQLVHGFRWYYIIVVETDICNSKIYHHFVGKTQSYWKLGNLIVQNKHIKYINDYQC